MRLHKIMLLTALCIGVGALAYADLQNVEVNGSIRIRGNWFDGSGDRSVLDTAFVEQRTRLGVKADFTQDVHAFIEVDSYDIWGEDFRSQNYLTGADSRANSNNDLEIFQGYIQAANIGGTGLTLTLGRQELTLGSGWLVGNNTTSSFFTGLSFDMFRLTYAYEDSFKVEAFAAKIAESYKGFEEGDADLYGIYATCTAVNNMTFDAYYLFLRDDGAGIGTAAANATLWSAISGFFGHTAKIADLHTLGLRAAGKYEGLDFEVENAWQFGAISDNADRRFFEVFVDDGDLNYSVNVGLNMLAGYTFDVKTSPHPFAGFAAFMGLDEGKNKPNLPFNRLFSNWEYSEFLENTDLSNCYVWYGGVDFKPLDRLTVKGVGTCVMADKNRHDDNAGAWELGLYADYKYTDDLIFRAGLAHAWIEDSLRDGDKITGNGLFSFNSGGSTNTNYVFLESELKF